MLVPLMVIRWEEMLERKRAERSADLKEYWSGEMLAAQWEMKTVLRLECYLVESSAEMWGWRMAIQKDNQLAYLKAV